MAAGRNAGTIIALEAQPLVLGRATEDGSSVPGLVDDAELSRRHARVSEVGGQLTIEDLGSSNGTFVNDRRIVAATPLNVGDRIKVGTTILTVESVPGAGDGLADPQATQARAVPAAAADPELTRARSAVPAADPQTTQARAVADPQTTQARAVADPQLTRARPPDGAAPPPPPGAGPLTRFIHLAARRPRLVLGGLALFFVIAVVVGIPVAGEMHANNPFNDHSSQSVRVNHLIEQATGELPGVQLIALVSAPAGVNAAGTQALVTSLTHKIAGDPGVTRTLNYYTTHSRSFVSRNGRSTYVAAFFKNASDNDAQTAAKRIVNADQKPPQVIFGGPAVANQQLGAEVGKDLGMAEGLAFPILFILSLFVFRGLVAALMPIFVGAITVMTTFLVLRIVNSFLSLSQFALNIVIGLGLGLAIDYSLFIVSRYREELVKDPDGSHLDALSRTMRTAGRTILFSATTVTLALATLCLFPMPFMVSMGLGGAITAIVAVTTASVALAALLAVLGTRINSLAPERWKRSVQRTASQERGGPWYRLSHAVMRHPAMVAIISAAVLIAAGIPVTGIKFIGVDASGVPPGLSARTVDNTLQSQYSSDTASQITALVRAPATDRTAITTLAQQLRGLPGALPTGTPPTALRNGYWTFQILPRQRPLAATTVNLVKEVRAHRSPAVQTSGTTASFLDQRSTISSRIIPVAIILCVLTAIVLFVMTGSLILPLKSLLMNFLSLSAAFGLLVLIFQDGHLQGVLGFSSLHAIDISQPVLIFAVAFGLASDYTVFLLTRIKEAHDAGHPNTDAVAIGLERTGRIVTQAAVLFCVAIGAFATGSVVFIKEVGVGTALAVIIDASVIRALLVPSLMALLGDRNWWAPAPLRRLYERIGLKEA